METLEYFSKGINILPRVIELSLLNIVFSFMNTGNIVRALEFKGLHIGFKFILPQTIVGLWDLCSIPSQKPSEVYVLWYRVEEVTGSTLSMLMLAVVGYSIIYAIASFFYIYYIVSNGLREEKKLNPRKIVDIIVYYIVIYTLLTIPVLLAIMLFNPLAAITAMTLVLILMYFIYATPFIIVVHNKNLLESLRTSIRSAFTSKYLSYTIAYAIATLVLSPLLTIIVTGLKFPGIIISSIIAGLVGLWLTISTTYMVNDIRVE